MTRTRIWLAAPLGLVMMTALPFGARAEPEPLRSGTIVSAVYTTSTAMDCQWLPDCRAWLESHCNPALTGRDPAWLTSIVDVADLADGTTPRVFEYRDVRRGGPPGANMGGVMVQFWREGCTEIPSSRWDPWDDVTWEKSWGTTLAVPSGAKWMTVGGNDSINFVWTLS